MLTLSTSLGTTYHKGARLIPGGPAQQAPDGYNADVSWNVTTVDPINLENATTQFFIDYVANPGNSWSTGSSYSWSGTQSAVTEWTSSGGQTGTFNPAAIPGLEVAYEQSVIPSGSGTGADKITISATDKDTGAQEQGVAHVTLYPPTNNWSNYATGSDISRASSLVALIGATALDLQPQLITNYSANFNQCWTDPYSTFNPPTTSTTPLATYEMTPELIVHYTPNFYHGDSYGAQGYSGMANFQAAPVSKIEWVSFAA